MKKEELSLEEICHNLCQELDTNTDDDMQAYIAHAKEFLNYSRDDLIAKEATHELLKTFLVIVLIQEKEIAKLRQTVKMNSRFAETARRVSDTVKVKNNKGA